MVLAIWRSSLAVLWVSDELRRSVNYKLSFSPMTFTHQMVRLLLVEQIYRASKINRNEPYHW
ncbi:MAG: 23S rRNA (pseudouridine(1915)-N(3))-methyltransferase RlmH [Veillonella sp.]